MRFFSSACLRGEQLEIENEEINDDTSKYTLKWNSNNIFATKKNKRERFPLILDVCIQFFSLNGIMKQYLSNLNCKILNQMNCFTLMITNVNVIIGLLI